jgi:predicted PurR-regulated permease PerM
LLLGFAAVTAALIFAVPRLSEQLGALSREAPKLLDRGREFLQRSALTRHLLPAASPQPAAGGAHPGELVNAAVGAIGGSLELLGGVAIVFFIGVYGAAQPEVYQRALLAVAPEQYRERLEKALSCARHDLARWMVGRLIAMLFVGVTSGVMFALLHVPAAFLLGVFAGLLTFVEYAGALISALPPIALAASQGPGRALAVLVLFVVLHVIEGYVLTPLLARASVHFPPALALAAQVLFGVLLGPLGLTFSTPLLVLIVSGAKGWREPAC